MARITVEDCLENVDNRFQLVLVATKRARQLANGANAHLAWENDKPTVLALREIADGFVGPAILDEVVVPVEDIFAEVEVEAEAGPAAEPTEAAGDESAAPPASAPPADED